MNINKVSDWLKAVWLNNKPFLKFIFTLWICYAVLKIIFYLYNYPILFDEVTKPVGLNTWWLLIKWSVFSDLIALFAVNFLLLLLLQCMHILKAGTLNRVFLVPVFILVNSFVLLLNIVDIFYFRFHFQRANADLLYVLDHPISRFFQWPILIILCIVITIIVVVYLVSRFQHSFFKAFQKGNTAVSSSVFLILVFSLLFFSLKNKSNLFLPTYPLVEIPSNQLAVVQNSFTTFMYSVYRRGEEVTEKPYFVTEICDSIFPIRKNIKIFPDSIGQKNIVLFIMESVPFDYFDPGNKYKLAMPFFDSIIERSIFFKNAFCYAHQSNKGITAILAGIPTLTDIPVYHSSYVHMPITGLGTALASINYKSLFCIGDDYDNFGFAKCMNWLGIEKYYSKKDIPGYKNLPNHTMGLHDEYVLNFFEKKISETAEPFLAIQYNISTHYPYDLPASFEKKATAPTAPMKSMQYYDASLHGFFNEAKKQSWFKNSIFIFCSDHWLVPDDKHISFNAISGYRIPIIIYDPANENKIVDDRPASQFDIAITILAIAGYKKDVISYGNDLLDNTKENKVVFSRANSTFYHAIDSSYILGFNNNTNKPEFLYSYRQDSLLKKNLLNDSEAMQKQNYLTNKIEAFLQKATMQYNGKTFK